MKTELQREDVKVKMKKDDGKTVDNIESPWRMVLQRFIKNPIGMAGFIILVALILIVALAPYISPYDPNEMNTSIINQPPSKEHWLGTDELGRDYFTRVLYGGRISMKVGLFAVIISVAVGSIIGGISGFYGGWVDNILMRFAEIVMSFPFLPLAITISAVVGTKVPPEGKMYIVMMIIGLLSWPGLARLVRGQILSLREQEFVLAAKAMGIKNRKIISRHLLPNTVGYIIVTATLEMASAIMSEAALSYLGLGVAPPVATWGNLIQYANNLYVLKNRAWLWIPPGICIILAVMSINLFGDGLRDAINPKSKVL